MKDLSFYLFSVFYLRLFIHSTKVNHHSQYLYYFLLLHYILIRPVHIVILEPVSSLETYLKIYPSRPVSVIFHVSDTLPLLEPFLGTYRSYTVFTPVFYLSRSSRLHSKNVS